MSDALKTATSITGPCSCHEAYTSRKLIAPDCIYHDFATEIAEALQATRAEALEEAAKVCDLQMEEAMLLPRNTRLKRTRIDVALNCADAIRAVKQ